MNTVSVNFDNLCGKVKPMHAINNVPTLPKNLYGMYDKLMEAHVPYSRLHDTGGRYGGSRFVDIANVFPDFDADETNPDSYDFAFTDVLLQEICKYGIKPFYRLGPTIENYHRIKAYNIYPPADSAKWARICEHIIRHYNEGWADGFRMGIEYWEVWNEPDNFPDIADNSMWKGTKEQYFELYEVTSKHLKKCFPDIKVGGYGSCGFYAISGEDFSRVANSTPRYDYFIEFLDAFLEYCVKNGCIIDFFSWHSYAGVKSNITFANYARHKMDLYGFTDCEIFLNEWNPNINIRGTLQDASNILSMMLALHRTRTDMCMYYDCQLTSSYCGIFDPVSKKPFKAYYAFYTFGKLYELGNCAECEVSEDGIYALGATDGNRKAVAIVNNIDKAVTVSLSVKGADTQKAEIYTVDEQCDFEKVDEKAEVLTLPPYGIKYIEFK